ncbi:MAG: D-glycero-beta-D-manno-heptose-7-phosphate kinase [Betaproteobacteria bacterium]|nr:D-glycero-beta-D-manno-heptose-7-phosphate kinase [Betaproteobacteria bacterium]MDE2209928.1 D-glycero-beta-D-manno-heptose-7-phosphate kinase [Betaproteobacteria bacterium]MDE2361022.1 D-glycero-beta-D-manno-heptose-7-phosphate kinase [Betaproteobacteria bacterium]
MSSGFSAWRGRVAKARVLVVGDVMLDRYWFGDVERISPEAPVPVVRIARSEERPGGAANVARNAAALGARATLLSATGDDEPADTLLRMLAADGVSTSFVRDGALTTTVKLRVIGRQQQLLRIDFEKAPSREILASKLADFDALLGDTDAVVLSDYGKGGLAHIATMIGRARAAGKPVLVDPKGDDWDKYRGASLMTPNRGEFRQVAGRWRDEADLERRAQALRRDLDLGALLVTRSEEGMSLYSDAGTLTIPAQAREVFDVSGAGDTVIATLGALLAAGAPLPDAVAIANRAAGVVVGKLGTATVTPDELA